MKNKGIIGLAITLFMISSCIPVTIHPVYHKNERVLNNKIIGSWDAGDNEYYHFNANPEDSMSYLMKYTSSAAETLDSVQVEFEINLTYLGQRLFADCFPNDIEGIKYKNEILEYHAVFMHTFYWIEFVSDTMLVYSMDADKLHKWLENEGKEYACHVVEGKDRLILTGSTDELQEIVTKSAEANVFGDVEKMVRK